MPSMPIADEKNAGAPRVINIPPPTLPLVLPLCRLHTALIPAGGATGAACDAYVWPHAASPPESEMAHIVRMARASVERRVLLLIACCHPGPLAAIKAAVTAAVAAGGKVTVQ